MIAQAGEISFARGSNRAGRDAGLGGDLLAGPAVAAQPLDLIDHGLGRRLPKPMRPGGAILQSRQSFAAISINPLNGPRTEAVEQGRHRVQHRLQRRADAPFLERRIHYLEALAELRGELTWQRLLATDRGEQILGSASLPASSRASEFPRSPPSQSA